MFRGAHVRHASNPIDHARRPQDRPRLSFQHFVPSCAPGVQTIWGFLELIKLESAPFGHLQGEVQRDEGRGAGQQPWMFEVDLRQRSPPTMRRQHMRHGCQGEQGGAPRQGSFVPLKPRLNLLAEDVIWPSRGLHLGPNVPMKTNTSPKSLPQERVILGIDPGTTIMGYGLIRTRGKSKVELIEMGALHLGKIKDHALKLKRIYDRVSGLIEAHAPDEMAVEAPFFGQNVQSMLKLGRAQGVALAAALSREVPVAEYAPRRVKQAVTGSGAASKEQVAGMVQRTLQIPSADMPKDLDATDGLAVALCHHFQLSTPTMQKGGSGWKAFISDNPDRVRR